MKEIVDRLADEAMVLVPGRTGLHARSFSLERYTELIVQECIAQCNDGDSKYFIATHFGLKE
jgi:hypothetical protein